MREWLVTVQGQNVPSSPHKEMPALQAPWDLADSQSSELETGDQAEEHRTDADIFNLTDVQSFLHATWIHQSVNGVFK